MSDSTSDVGMMYRGELQRRGVPLTNENLSRLIMESRRTPDLIEGLTVQGEEPGPTGPPVVAPTGSPTSGRLPTPPMPPDQRINTMIGEPDAPPPITKDSFSSGPQAPVSNVSGGPSSFNGVVSPAAAAGVPSASSMATVINSTEPSAPFDPESVRPAPMTPARTGPIPRAVAALVGAMRPPQFPTSHFANEAPPTTTDIPPPSYIQEHGPTLDNIALLTGGALSAASIAKGIQMMRNMPPTAAPAAPQPAQPAIRTTPTGPAPETRAGMPQPSQQDRVLRNTPEHFPDAIPIGPAETAGTNATPRSANAMSVPITQGPVGTPNVSSTNAPVAVGGPEIAGTQPTPRSPNAQSVPITNGPPGTPNVSSTNAPVNVGLAENAGTEQTPKSANAKNIPISQAPEGMNAKDRSFWQQTYDAAIRSKVDPERAAKIATEMLANAKAKGLRVRVRTP